MPQYMMILHETTTGFAGLSPAEMQAVIARYQAWSAKVAQAGQLAGGHKLRDGGGKHLRKPKGKLEVSDGPYAEAKEVVGGLFQIIAADYKEAVRIAQDCPHLDLGGWIELREIEPT